MFSCYAPLRRLSHLGNLLVSIGGLLLDPPKAFSSSPASPVPSASPRPVAFPAVLPQSGIWDCPCAGAECVPVAGLCIWPCWASWGCCWPFLQPMQVPLEGGFALQHVDYILFSDCISIDLAPVSTCSQFLNWNLLARLTVAFSI